MNIYTIIEYLSIFSIDNIWEKRKNTWSINTKWYSIALVSVAMILGLISIAGAATFAYITNLASNNVYVIDTATNNVTATVNGLNNPYGVAVNPLEQRFM